MKLVGIFLLALAGYLLRRTLFPSSFTGGLSTSGDTNIERIGSNLTLNEGSNDEESFFDTRPFGRKGIVDGEKKSYKPSNEKDFLGRELAFYRRLKTAEIPAYQQPFRNLDGSYNVRTIPAVPAVYTWLYRTDYYQWSNNNRKWVYLKSA